jgi:hypothetical protein
MKPQEILFASAVIAVVAGAGAALAASALTSAAPRLETTPLELAPSANDQDPRPELAELRADQADLLQRLHALEARLAEAESRRAPAALELEASAARAVEPRAADGLQIAALDTDDLSPAFVESVGLALERIQAREEAEREKRRKELQAQRIEDRVAKLQQDLGLTQRQASDLRTVLIAQDDKRDALFAGMRDGLGEPRDMREGFRTIRDQTMTAIEGFLTPEQVEGFRSSEEGDFRGRGQGDFGPGPMRGEGVGERRGRREGG